MSEAELLFKDAAGYLKPEDIAQLETAYQFSEAAHEGQFRKSGEPYISHPLAVANILAQWHLDPQALTAALLHDVMEDTAVTKTEISDKFGKPVAELVDGVSKLDQIEFETHEEAQAENFRKMLLAMARDVRVILIKLADRLHNMRTLDGHAAEEARAHRARDARDLRADRQPPGAEQLYQELEDLASATSIRTASACCPRRSRRARGNRREVVDKILDAIKQKLADSHIEATVTGREKHLYSIYNKMREKNLSFAQVLDIFGFRIIVKDVPPAISRWARCTSSTSRFPASSRTTSRSPKPTATSRCTPRCSARSAARSKSRSARRRCTRSPKPASPRTGCTRARRLAQRAAQKTHQWLQSLLEMQSESGDSVEFLEHLKVDLFPDEVYVFTPKGKIMALPHGATAWISPTRCTPTSATAASR